MKLSKLKFKPMNKSPSANLAVTMIATTVILLATLGALNGNIAPTAGVWDALVTTLKNLLTSSWVIALAFVALVAAVWQIAHGRGYTALAVIMGLLATALIGPDMVIGIATATSAPSQLELSAGGSFYAQQSNSLPTVLRAAR